MLKKRVVLAFIASVSIAALVLSVVALIEAGKPQVDEELRSFNAVMMAQWAAERYVSWGRDEVVRYYNTPASRVGGMFVFIMDEGGETLAHPNAAVVGKSVVGNMNIVDGAGRSVGHKLLEAGEEGLWVEYEYTDYATGERERKHTWVVKRDDLLFASGWDE